MTARVYFSLCLVLGRLLRSARYSQARVVEQEGVRQVRKRRSFYAAVLIRLSEPLIRILDGRVRVLPQRDWEERERQIYRELHDVSVQVEPGGTLVLPCLPGTTLAALLEDPGLAEAVRKEAIASAAAALAELHRRGFTHADAMAENVLVDLESGAAHWFDFETVHDPTCPIAWRRSDDVRALLATCLLRTDPENIGKTLGHVLDAYADAAVLHDLAASFRSVWRRPLTLHLLQAGLSYERFQEIGRLLRCRAGCG